MALQNTFTMQRMDTALVCFRYIDISLVLSVLVRFILYVLDTEIVHTFDHLLVSDHLVSLRFYYQTQAILIFID